MITVRKSDDRGDFQIDWLKSKHSFSFGSYFDERHMGFGPLRVINEDRVAGDGGFQPHGHRDMEILSYVISGALEHKDNKGNQAVIRPGELQRMTAGTGIMHSEFNSSKTDPVHFLQIWIMPEKGGLQPGYEQIAFPEEDRRNTLKLIGSNSGEAGSVTIHQDVRLYGSLLDAGETVSHSLEKGRGAWVQVVKGSLEIGDEFLTEGDGAAVRNLDDLTITAVEDAEFLLFDLPLQ